MELLTDKEFLRLLAQKDIRVTVRNANLHIDAPVGALNNLLRAELKRRKISLLSTLSDAPPFSSSSIINQQAELAPLTSAQERIWLIEKFHPGSAAYSISEAFALNYSVNQNAFRKAVRLLTQRHKILGSFIEEENGRPMMRYTSDFDTPVTFQDLSSFSGPQQKYELSHAVSLAAKKPFDLKSAPFIRFVFYYLGSNRSAILLNVHHIVADRWSLNILWRELLHYYTDNQTQLAPLPINFSDYALWEQNFSTASQFQPQIDYWKRQLDGVPPTLDLPFRNSRPVSNAFSGELYEFSISKKRLEELKALASVEKTSLFILLLTAFSALLYRYTRQEDFCIGSPISGRNQIELEPLIGLFVNTILIRCKLSSSLTFKKYLHSIHRTALDGYANKDVPFQQLIKGIIPDRNNNRSPFFQIMFAFDTAKNEDLALAQQINAHSGTSKLDLTLQLTEHANGLSGVIEYKTDLFDSYRMEQLAEHFSNLLDFIVLYPDTQIGKLTFLSEAQRTTILSDWNKTSAKYSYYESIHSLFESQTAKTPEADAILFEAQAISYGEVNRRANQLAHYLISKGAAPETFVGVYLDRRPEMVISMLAVLKTGAAYVPLDPAYPQNRLSFIVEDCGLRLCISTSSQQIQGPNLSVEAICLDSDATAIASMRISNPYIRIKENNAAYIIYTSGSTGTPKGVVVEHRNTLSFLQWAQSAFSSEALNGVLAGTSICFDLSIFEIFFPLCFGYTLILADSILQLPHLPFKNRVTLINSVPSAIAALLKSGPLPSKVKVINLAGEYLPSSLVRDIYESSNAEFIYDLYGPSETTTYSTFAHRDANESFPTIGRPISNTRVYILDTDLQPVPPCVKGEIYIAGAGVTRGYLNRPELTEERFVSLKHLGETGLSYRTGDIAKFRPDGNIEYVGRSDHQVKLRGYRIELGEIESWMKRFDCIQDAVVLVFHDAQAGERIIGFISTGDPQNFHPQELTAFLREHLPAYMVVTDITALRQFPLTANGKIDRNALLNLYEPSHKLVLQSLPRDMMEKQVANIWEHCFQRTQIGIYDNFFEIGGHSLLAFQIFSMIEKLIGKQMMLASLLQFPSIALLSQLISREGGKPPASISVIHLDGTRPAIYGVLLTQDSSTTYKTLSRHFSKEQPIYEITASPNDSFTSMDQSALTCAEDICRYQPDGPYIILSDKAASAFAYKIATELRSQKLAVRLIFINPDWISLLNEEKRHSEEKSNSHSFFKLWMGEKHRQQAVPFDGDMLCLNPFHSKEIAHLELAWIRHHKNAVIKDIPCTEAELLSEPYASQIALLIETFLGSPSIN